MIAGPPSSPIVLPRAVRELAADGAITPVWRNELGGLTFQLGDSPRRRFLKWAPAGSGLDLNAERLRLRWAAPLWPVPTVLDHGTDEEGSWFVTAGLDGESAVSPRWLADPAVAVRAIGEGLRAMHDTLPVPDCPFSARAQERYADAQRRAEAGQIDPQQWHEVHRPLSIRDALARAADAPEPDRLVVCHGDACAPNTLIDPDGRWSGHVDLGRLGVADRWSDIAIASWSIGWNYGPGREADLFAAYGVQPDHERIAYYRLLQDLGP